MKKQKTITHQVDTVVIRELFPGEFLCSLCLESGINYEDAVHDLDDQMVHPRRGILCCPHCAECDDEEPN